MTHMCFSELSHHCLPYMCHQRGICAYWICMPGKHVINTALYDENTIKRCYLYNENFYSVKTSNFETSSSFVKMLITDNVINGRRITLPQIWIVQYHLVFPALFWTHNPWMSRYYSNKVMQLVDDPLVISYPLLLWWFAYEYKKDIDLVLRALLGF